MAASSSVKDTTKRLTSGSPMSLILGFSLPLLVGMLFQQFYSLVDTIIVGKFLGVNALAAVGSTGSVNFLINGFCMGVCTGFAIPVAQRFGAEDEKGLRRYVGNSIWLSAVFAVIMTVIVSVFCREILILMQTPADIIDDAYAYIFIIFVGIPVTYLYNLTSGIIRSLGDSKTPVYFLLMASALNIVLDIIFVLFFHAGVFGAALATVISQAVAGLWSLAYMVKNFRMLGWSREEGRFSTGHCAKLCMMGLPMGLQCSITAVGNIVLQTAVNGLGSSIVAAMTAGSKAGQILSVPLESIGTAMTTYTSQNLGAGSLPRVKQGVRTALGISILYSIASFVILHFSDTLLIGLFLDSAQDAGGTIMSNAQEFLFWNSVFYIPLAVLIIYRYSIQGLGYSGLAMFAGVFEMFARALVGFWMVPVFGYWAGCIASPVAWFAACFFLIPAYQVVIRRLDKNRDGSQSAAGHTGVRLRKA